MQQALRAGTVDNGSLVIQDSEGEDAFGPYEFVLDWTLIINRGSTRDSDDPLKSLERATKALEQLSQNRN